MKIKNLKKICGRIMGLASLVVVVGCEPVDKVSIQSSSGYAQVLVVPKTPDLSLLSDEDRNNSNITCSSNVFYAGSDQCEEKGLCDNKLNCICGLADKKIYWLTAGKRKFKLKPISPSNTNDLDKGIDLFDLSNKKTKMCFENFKTSHTCKLKKHFKNDKLAYFMDYQIVFEHCSNGTDPRVVVNPPKFGGLSDH